MYSDGQRRWQPEFASGTKQHIHNIPNFGVMNLCHHIGTLIKCYFVWCESDYNAYPSFTFLFHLLCWRDGKEGESNPPPHKSLADTRTLQDVVDVLKDTLGVPRLSDFNLASSDWISSPSPIPSTSVRLDGTTSSMKAIYVSRLCGGFFAHLMKCSTLLSTSPMSNERDRVARIYRPVIAHG